MILNNLIPIQSKPSDKENISASQQKLTNPDCSQNKIGKKRQRQEDNCQKNVVKKLRNCGKSYQTLKAKKSIPECTLKPPCRESCAFKCRSNITEERRLQLFKEYWDLGNIENSGHLSQTVLKQSSQNIVTLKWMPMGTLHLLVTITTLSF
ncbi:uncharacterized protein LOC126882804 [Diabrotica virgifera virgifera]|uniref:Uncharacterized protein n=1 Tax=Diabrotica virgifera virgifera TaxID=50390 RepID=A0ABM5K0X0_DIAVI|nr:uncharacterized protein LOC126882804 [Diabrotica virgifera virgifera]